MKFNFYWKSIKANKMFLNNDFLHLNSPRAGASNPVESKHVHKHNSSVKLIISCHFSS